MSWEITSFCNLYKGSSGFRKHGREGTSFSGIARVFPGVQAAHPEGQIEGKKRKNKKKN